MKPIFIMLVGISGAGKSTIAKDFYKLMDNSIIISSDAIRAELWGDENCQHNPKKVFEIMNARTLENLKKGVSVIYDATNLISARRSQLIKQIKPYCKQVNCLFMDKTLNECAQNQTKRKRQVPYDVIRKQLSQLEVPKYSEGWDKILVRYD